MEPAELAVEAAAGHVILKSARVAERKPPFGTKVMVNRYRELESSAGVNCPSLLRKKVDVVTVATGLAGILIANCGDAVALPRGVVTGVACRSAITAPMTSAEATC